mmetsp:Transcript_22657/g.56265  ORF Transcript_22657/g.56265 Transcript_22657/m.56265 type:complete len:148 (+) Transcript_22657:275-718(+)
MRSKTVLKVKGLVLNCIRPRFAFSHRLKLILKVLPLAWTLLLLWAGWTNLLPKNAPTAYYVSDLVHMCSASLATVLLLLLWPLWPDLFRAESPPDTVMALVGRTVPEILAKRRFYRWSDSYGQFNLLPTIDGIMVFPVSARFRVEMK